MTVIMGGGFSSRARIWGGKGLMNHSPPALLVEISSYAPVPLLRSGSVQSWLTELRQTVHYYVIVLDSHCLLLSYIFHVFCSQNASPAWSAWLNTRSPNSRRILMPQRMPSQPWWRSANTTAPRSTWMTSSHVLCTGCPSLKMWMRLCIFITTSVIF